MHNFIELIETLKLKGLTIGSAESFTGGMFGKLITDIPGASEVYKGGVICYSNEVKTKVLGIDPALIKEKGVVSTEVAQALAINGAKLLNVDVCVGFTGNAGPGVCDNGALPGDVFISIYYKKMVYSVPLKYRDTTRDKVRSDSISTIVQTIMTIIER